MPVERRIGRPAAAVAVLAATTLLVGCTTARPPIGPVASRVAPTRSPIAVVHDPCGDAPVPSTDGVDLDALPAGPDFTATAGEANGRRLILGARTYAFRDFTPADGTIDGAVVGPSVAALQGSGPGRSVLRVQPGTSTHAADIPSAFPDTNQLSVLRVTGDVRYLGGFTVQGTDQGHLYNGLRVDKLQHLYARDIAVVAIPGGASSPPGETFGLNDYRTSHSDYAHIEVDGAGVGAAGFGANGSDDIRVCDSTSHDNPHSMGFAFWTVKNIELVDCTALRNGRAGFNFERVTGTVRLVRPAATGNRTDMSIASDQGSANYTIEDPHLTAGHWTVTLPRTYYGKPNKQRRSQIHLVVGGKQRDDLIRFESR